MRGRRTLASILRGERLSDVKGNVYAKRHARRLVGGVANSDQAGEGLERQKCLAAFNLRNGKKTWVA